MHNTWRLLEVIQPHKVIGRCARVSNGVANRHTTGDVGRRWVHVMRAVAQGPITWRGCQQPITFRNIPQWPPVLRTTVSYNGTTGSRASDFKRQDCILTIHKVFVHPQMTRPAKTTRIRTTVDFGGRLAHNMAARQPETAAVQQAGAPREIARQRVL